MVQIGIFRLKKIKKFETSYYGTIRGDGLLIHDGASNIEKASIFCAVSCPNIS